MRPYDPNMIVPPPPDDASDNGVAPPHNQFAARAAVTHGLSYAAVYAVLVFGAPQFARIFKDFDATLPMITQGALALADWFGDYWFFVAVMWLVGIGNIVARDHTRGRSAARGLSFAWLMGVLLFLGFLVVAFFFPLLGLIQKLS